MEAMSKEAREARNAYFREWRRRNPEKAKRIRQRYWERKAEELKWMEKVKTEVKAEGKAATGDGGGGER